MLGARLGRGAGTLEERLVIVCPLCNKENQDHYKFCLGCGSELPRDAAQQPKRFTAPTPPSGMPAVEAPEAHAPTAAPPASAAPAAAPPASAAPAAPGFGGAPVVATGEAAAPSADTVTCPKCGASVPASFKFCGTCGNPMEGQPAAASQAPAAAPAPAAASSPFRLVLIRPDGTEGEALPLAEGETAVGRDSGPTFASDVFLSPHHATFVVQGGKVVVRDAGSLNGVFYQVDRNVAVPLEDGTVFRIGQEIIRFERLPEPQKEGDVERMGSPNPGYLGRIVLVIGKGVDGNAYCVPAEGMHLGRERGDVLFPEDGYVSGLHCRIHLEGGKVVLTDVGSSNGTFLRIEGEKDVAPGTLLLMGQQLFRLDA